MKQLLFFIFFVFVVTNTFSQTYTPAPENIANRKLFQDNKFGMFIHWGASSVLGQGEWVMQQKNIRVNEYSRLINIFNPQNFNAAKWGHKQSVIFQALSFSSMRFP